MIGQTVSHYRILDKLGEGGMGIVYKAHDEKLDRIVAMKFLPHYLASDATEKERFVHEARAASALNHPHITTIYEIDEAGDHNFIAMEYVDGKTVKQLVEGETPSIKKVLDIAIQASEGLAAAHEKGVVHRDIKSDNIMVTPKGQVKIMDFGLAKLRGATKLTKEGSTLGTAAYMSPEQATGEEIDHRSDIFSFGVVLYELLAGNLPFRGEHQSAILYSIMNEEPQPVARYNNKVTPELERIVAKALSKEKDERYQHIDDVLADLRRERKNLEYVKSSGVVQPVQAARQRTNMLPWVAAGGVLVVLAVLFFIFNPFQAKESEETAASLTSTPGNSLAVMYFENIPDPEDETHTGAMLTNLLITALSQTQGLEVISRERLYDIQKELGQADAKSINPSLATELAQRAGVGTMLLGTVIQERPKLAVTSRLIEVKTGKILGSQKVTGFASDRIFDLVDSLAALVQKDLQVTKAGPVEAKSVAEVTSKSPEAYRSYLEGVELVKRFYYSEARAALERALELDPEFAMAHFEISSLYGDLGDLANRTKALQRAWQLRNNVTEKERLQIQAAYVRIIEKNPAKAAEILETMLQKYPHEQRAYADLSRSYNTLGMHEKALQAYEKAVRIDSLDKISWNSLAYAYAGLDRKADAIRAVDRYLSLAPGEPNPYDSKGEIYFIFGDIDSALAWFKRAMTFRSDFVTGEKLGDQALLDQDYVNAERHFRQFATISDKFLRAWAEGRIAMIPAHQGMVKEARNQVSRLLASHREKKLEGSLINTDYTLLTLLAYEGRDYPAMLEYAKSASAELRKNSRGVIQGRDLVAWAEFKNGNAKRASEILHSMESDVRGQDIEEQSLYPYTSALLAFEKGDHRDAVEKFRESLRPHNPNHAPQIFYAVSLLKTGQTDDAIDELKRVTWWYPISFTPISLGFLSTTEYWPIAAVKAHYWLGVAYEEKGNTNKAIAEFEKFLQIWKDADKNIPELTDARTRIASLKGQ